MISFFQKIKYLIRIGLLQLKWWAFEPYYRQLLAQAEFLYRQSELYKLRRNELGTDFANESFKENAQYFFWKAREEPFLIRARLFWNSLTNKEAKPYYLAD